MNERKNRDPNDASHTLMLEFPGIPRLSLKLLAKLIQQLRQTRVGSPNYPAMGAVHGVACLFNADRYK